MKEELIQSDPSIMKGKPVVAGTRITVELILEKLAAQAALQRMQAFGKRREPFIAAIREGKE